MKFMLVILCFWFSFTCQAAGLHVDDGIYYSYWVRGDVNNYKISDEMSNKPYKTGTDYYFINNTIENSNDEVYMLVKNGIVEFFYKHDEVEGGPSIGWATAKMIDDKIFVDSPTVKSFYDDTIGDTDKSIKYKVGVEFHANNRPAKEQEVIPLQKINNIEYKVDCAVYFDENIKLNNTPIPKDDPMKDYSKKVLINNNGICNLILDRKPYDGWVLFKKIA